jgi:hypothetical protein
VARGRGRRDRATVTGETEKARWHFEHAAAKQKGGSGKLRINFAWACSKRLDNTRIQIIVREGVRLQFGGVISGGVADGQIWRANTNSQC